MSLYPGMKFPKEESATAAHTAKPATAAKGATATSKTKVAAAAPAAKAKTFDSIREGAFANLAGGAKEEKAKEPEVKRNAYGFPLPAE